MPNNHPHGGRRDNRKRRPDDKRGGARLGAGRPRLLTVRVPLADAPALLDWLHTHQPPDDHPARRGWDFVAAELWNEEVRTKQEKNKSAAPRRCPAHDRAEAE